MNPVEEGEEAEEEEEAEPEAKKAKKTMKKKLVVKKAKVMRKAEKKVTSKKVASKKVEKKTAKLEDEDEYVDPIEANIKNIKKDKDMRLANKDNKVSIKKTETASPVKAKLANLRRK